MITTINELMKMQRELDARICNKFALSKNILFGNTKMACMVEIGEFANEIEFFKHWKQHKRCDIIKQKDEFADVMHFILSLMNQSGEEIKEDLTLDKIVLVIESRLNDDNRLEVVRSNFESLINSVVGGEYFLGLVALVNIGVGMGWSCDDMIAEYVKKNEINHKRQDANY